MHSRGDMRIPPRAAAQCAHSTGRPLSLRPPSDRFRSGAFSQGYFTNSLARLLSISWWPTSLPISCIPVRCRALVEVLAPVFGGVVLRWALVRVLAEVPGGIVLRLLCELALGARSSDFLLRHFGLVARCRRFLLWIFLAQFLAA